MFKKNFGVILVGAALVGCVSPATQMLNNKFLDAQITRPETVGIWTAALAGGLSTIKLNEDGSGSMCEDSGNQVNVYQVRNSNDHLYIQNGMILKKTQINEEFLHVKTTLSAFNVEMKYRADNNLKLATPKCQKELE